MAPAKLHSVVILGMSMAKISFGYVAQLEEKNG